MARIRTDRRDRPPQSKQPEEQLSVDVSSGAIAVSPLREDPTSEPGTSFPMDVERKSSKTSHDQLKYLKDSLSTFFTPAAGRRSRQAPKKFEDEGMDKPSKIGKAFSDVSPGSTAGMMVPLSVDVSHEVKSTPASSRRSSEVHSPQRRACETLVDSLSTFFSASSEKRRTVSRGEFAYIENSPGTSSANFPYRDNEFAESKKKMSGRVRKSDAELKPVVGGRNTQNSASAALFSSPSKDDRLRSSGSCSPPHKRVRTPKQSLRSTGSSSTRKREESEEEDKTSDELKATPKSKHRMREKKKKKSVSVVSPASSTSGEKENIGADYIQDGQVQVTDDNRNLFEEAQRRTQRLIDEAIQDVADRVASSDPSKDSRWPLAIRIRNFEIKTWYSAPYPQEYAHVAVLHICEYCLKYMRSEKIMNEHRKKCTVFRPPGNEIYRHQNTSVFEVDGNVSRLYCQNLCLLAKLFLDHKTLYYDVEPFLFYVVTSNDEYGQHFVGYFSKEKYSAQKFNLSCIVTLPCYQKQGFGRFLIDFSFLLSRRENMLGTPERPLSDLGRISYASYWRTSLFEWLHLNGRRGKYTILDIAKGTGVSVYDIVEVFDALNWFQKTPDGLRLEVNQTMIEAHWKKAKGDKARIWMNEGSLKWVPVKHTPTKDFGLRSPVLTLTPQRSPMSTANVGSTPTGVSIAAVGSTVKKGGPPKVSKKKAARQLKLSTSIRPKVITSSSEDVSSSESDNSPARKGCRGFNRRRPKENKSSDDDEDTASNEPKTQKKNGKAAPNKTVNSSSSKKETNPSSGSKNRCTVSRGKAVYEDNDSSSLLTSSSSEDDFDEPFRVGGRSQKGSKGKAPPIRRRKHAPKKSGKCPGKGKVQPSKDLVEPSTSTRKPSPARCDSPTTSVGTSATVPMRTEDDRMNSPGGGRTLNDVDDDIPIRSPSTSRATIRSSPTGHASQRPSRSSNRGKGDPPSSTASSVESSDDSRPVSPCSRTPSLSSRGDSPRPMGDRFPEHVNMGGIPDDDDEDDAFSRCAPSEESDLPPQLHAESTTEVNLGDGSSSGGEAGTSGPPPLLSSEIGYNTDDDEAPPKLSPALASVPMDDECTDLTEEERHQLEMDRPPKAPVMVNDVAEEEIAYHSSVHNVIDASGSSSHMMQQQASTPLQAYPGSLHQATPDSVPSCHMSNQQTTPEMQPGPFMSPQMQQAVMQPSSVSSVHSAHNSSLEHVGPSSAGPPQSFSGMPPVVSVPQDAAGPIHSQCLGANSFGSPPTQAQPMRSSTDAVPPPNTSQRRSGEGSRKQRTQSQPQMQPNHQQALPPHFMQTAAAPFGYGSQYPGYGGYQFDPSAFSGTHPYFQSGYPYGKAAATNTAMGNMVQTPMLYNYQNNMGPNVHQQVQWPRYPATGPVPVPSFPAAANPAAIPQTPYFGAAGSYTYFPK